MKAVHLFSRREFHKKYADGRQKKGGKLYEEIENRTNTFDTRGTPVPQPSMHKKMRDKNIHGPILKSAARQRWLRSHRSDGSLRG